MDKPKAATRKMEAHSINHRTLVGKIRRANTEAKIIEAAIQVFAEKGPQGAVIDDFIKAAGIARGTFYNYFRTTNELLEATQTWLRDDLIKSIEDVLIDVTDPITRFGLGIRLWMKRAESDRAWCGFVSQVRLFGSPELGKPIRDLKRALRAKEVKIPNLEAAMDLVEGSGTNAMQRIFREPTLKNHGDKVAILILQGLGVDSVKIKEIINWPLPGFRRLPRSMNHNPSEKQARGS